MAAYSLSPSWSGKGAKATVRSLRADHHQVGSLASPKDSACIPRCSILHQLADSLGKAMEAKDLYTRFHSEQVANWARALALEVGLSLDQAEAVHLAGHLHDIGKLSVPNEILQKPTRLTALEWAEVKKHPVTGARILAPVEAFNGRFGIAEMVLHHHERWDGQGYPDRIGGLEIPLGSRILAVADTLSALIQDRPYRPGKPFGEALAELRRVAGSQLDPDLVEAFHRLVSRDSRRY